MRIKESALFRHERYKIESTILELECYRLLAIIHSSKSLHERILSLRTESELDLAFAYRRSEATLAYHTALEEWEANRILLSLAIAVRNGLDHRPILEDSECGILISREFTDNELGEILFKETPALLWVQLEHMASPVQPLMVRETCNKVVHAIGVEGARTDLKSAKPDVSKDDGRPLTGHVWLSGFRNSKKQSCEIWVALIDVEKFALSTSGEY